LRGYSYILVFIDVFSGWAEAFPVETRAAEEVVKHLMDDIICRFGVPEKILTDGAAEFNGQLMTTCRRMLGVSPNAFTAYHPQTRGKLERFNRTLEMMIRSYAEKDAINWDLQLPILLFAYRTAIATSSGKSPHLVLFGRPTLTPLDIALGLSPVDDDLMEEHQGMWDKVYHAVAQHQYVYKRRYDASSKEVVFKTGDKVLLYTPYSDANISKKLSHLWTGPWTILRPVHGSKLVYELQQEGKPTIVKAHVLRLKPFRSLVQFPRRLIDRVISHQDLIVGDQASRVYLVHWKNTSARNDSWETEDNIPLGVLNKYKAH